VRAPRIAGTLVGVEEWGFIWLMFVLKIPIAAMLWLVWWAVTSQPEPIADSDDSDGGSGTPRVPLPHGGPRSPHRRPRGPHGDPSPSAPERTRAPGRDLVARHRASR